MAGVMQGQVFGLGELLRDVGKLGNIPGAVMKAAVRAKADVTQKTVDFNAEARLNGRYSEGVVARSSKIEKVRCARGNASCQLNFKGEQHKTRVAEIAFLNEYGVHGTVQEGGRHFIADASRDKGTRDAGDQAAADVLFDWMRTINL